MILHVAAWSLIKHIHQHDDRQTLIHGHIDVCVRNASSVNCLLLLLARMTWSEPVICDNVYSAI